MPKLTEALRALAELVDDHNLPVSYISVYEFESIAVSVGRGRYTDGDRREHVKQWADVLGVPTVDHPEHLQVHADAKLPNGWHLHVSTILEARAGAAA